MALGNKKRGRLPQNHTKSATKLAEVRMPNGIKIHFLPSHLSLLSENLGTVSDEQSERFRQIEPKWRNNIKEGKIWLWWGFTSGFFVRNMNFPIKEEGSHKIIELSIFK
jgi:hypothetical protein